MQSRILAHALVTATVALSVPLAGAASTLAAAYLSADEIALLSEAIDPDTLARREAFLRNHSVVEVDIDVNMPGIERQRTGIRVDNNASADEVLWIDGSIDLTVELCDGSVLVAIPGVTCDGSVMPVAQMVLSLQSTFNPSVWMALTYTTSSTGVGSNVGVAILSGINPFGAGSLLQGTMDASLGLVVRNPDGPLSPDAIAASYPGADLGVQIQRRSDFAELGSYTGGIIDNDTLYRAGTETDGLGGPIGIDQTQVIDTTLSPGLFSCDFCTNGGVLMAFQMAPSPHQGLQSQAIGEARFTYSAAPPGVIPLPAAGWLLLGGLGALWGMARRRRRAV